LLSPNRILPCIRTANPNEKRIIGSLPIRRHLATPNEVAAPDQPIGESFAGDTICAG
jgi:hypothetical protein